MPWTEITRPNYDRRSGRYASDSTDEEWALVAPFMPPSSKVGRPRRTNMRAVWDAIQYIAATGCQWALLPREFPPFTTVQYYFYRLRDDGSLDLINSGCSPWFFPVKKPACFALPALLATCDKGFGSGDPNAVAEAAAAAAVAAEAAAAAAAGNDPDEAILEAAARSAVAEAASDGTFLFVFRLEMPKFSRNLGNFSWHDMSLFF